MPGLSREGVEVKTGVVLAAAATVAIMAAGNNRDGGVIGHGIMAGNIAR
jgi:hypothetical protein